MVRRTRGSRRAALAVALATAPVLAGCGHALRQGAGLLGGHGRQPTGIEARAVDRSPTKRARADRPAATVGTYEAAPNYTWGGYATATPASFARLFTAGPEGKSCTLGSVGLARVLPIGLGAPAIGVQRFGPVTVGIAGPGVDAFREFMAMSQYGFAQAAMRTTAESGTWGTCGRGLFAFVSLGPGNAYEPVVVR